MCWRAGPHCRSVGFGQLVMPERFLGCGASAVRLGTAKKQSRSTSNTLEKTMPRKRARPLFELGGQWIAREPGSPFYHRFWTEPGTGRTRRASLRTEDLDAATKLLAEIVVKGSPKTQNAPLSAVLLDYFESRTDRLPARNPLGMRAG